MQGGLSFLSTQYGWAANNIVEVEMVLPNSTIVTASASSNPDLLAVIKGGGSAFGIVTRYVLQAHPIGQVGLSVMVKVVSNINGTAGVGRQPGL